MRIRSSIILHCSLRFMPFSVVKYRFQELHCSNLTKLIGATKFVYLCCHGNTSLQFHWIFCIYENFDQRYLSWFQWSKPKKNTMESLDISCVFMQQHETMDHMIQNELMNKCSDRDHLLINLRKSGKTVLSSTTLWLLILITVRFRFQMISSIFSEKNVR